MKKVLDEEAFGNNLRRLRERIAENTFLNEEQAEKIYQYFKMLLEKNNVMNLTAIVEADEVYVKHLEDSMSVIPILLNSDNFQECKNSYGKGLKILDLGTGAGLPGIILAILLPQAEFILADALSKRIKFLAEVCAELELKNVELIHSRAEDMARDSIYRDNIDIVISRAVASMPTLIEYCLPLLKVGAKLIAMKSKSGELDFAQNALKELKGSPFRTIELKLTDGSERCIYLIKKNTKTSNKFPRKNGQAKNNPL